MPRCAVLCYCAMLCYEKKRKRKDYAFRCQFNEKPSIIPGCPAVLCYTTLRYATLRYATLCYAMPCYAMLCHAMPCYAMLCYAMLCYAMLCYARLHAHVCNVGTAHTVQCVRCWIKCAGDGFGVGEVPQELCCAGAEHRGGQFETGRAAQGAGPPACTDPGCPPSHQVCWGPSHPFNVFPLHTTCFFFFLSLICG